MEVLKKHKLIISLFLIALFLIIILLVLIKYKVGDLRPALTPAKKDIVKILEKQKTGEQVQMPLTLPSNLQIGVFAKDLSDARDLQFSPGGVLLVSVPSQGKVFAFPDKNNDGVADQTVEIISGLNRPHGLAFHDGKLFIAELTRLVRYTWDEQNLKASAEKTLFTIPFNAGHNTRTVAIKDDGTLFVSIGSSCNICVEAHEWLASVIVSNVNGENPKLFAKGLRNSVFIVLHPTTKELWGTENSRDWLGDNAPPDEINIIHSGKDYGWPYCWGDKVHDSEVDNRKLNDPCGKTESPVFKIQAHSAPLGLAFIDSPQFPKDWQGDLLVSYHGSWNRSTPTGYKVVRLKVDGNKVTEQEDFLTGFLDSTSALGRPVDLTFDAQGSLYISDDKAGVIYKVVN